MEKNIIISKIVEKEVYQIEKCVQTSEQSCNLFLVNQNGNFVRKDLPFDKVSALLRKHSWIWTLIFGNKYRSEYTADVLPYYDNGWKSFIWRDSLDGKEFSCNSNFPESLSDFFRGFDNLYSRFVCTLKDCFEQRKKQLSDKMRLSPVLDIYWAEILLRYPKKRNVLKNLHSLLILISYDRRTTEKDETTKPMSIEKYLCMMHHINDIDFDYEKLANTYLDNIYEFLYFCYRMDEATLSDIYGETKNIGKDVSILDYESYLCLFDAVDLVIKCLDVR